MKQVIIVMGRMAIKLAHFPLCCADKQAGIVTQKNSCGRNLHRLNVVLTFLRLLLNKLLDDANMSVKVAERSSVRSSLFLMSWSSVTLSSGCCVGCVRAVIVADPPIRGSDGCLGR